MPQVSKKTLNVGGRLVDLSIPKVMGILNLTPDSFYHGSRIASVDQLIDIAGSMWEQGASFIDIGGYSTRPGAIDISVSEELDRLMPVVEPLNKFLPEIIISVDTFRSEVAKLVVAKGAHIVNDVSGGTLDPHMLREVLALKVPYVLMHMRGTPQTMQQLTGYGNVVEDVIRDLLPTIRRLEADGLADIIVDPGFGFAKTQAQNFELLRHLDAFQALNLPILVGVSRKAMVWRTLGCAPQDALNGTTALHMLAIERGASILRVHDVRPAVEVIKLWSETHTLQ
ncbi:dihydropteroate synthase [Dyadobacter jejuensis]|uniref:dihydropteroate synthase n=1 Tax=Dyadobacter jejuensis TaxID=1082580 RepID=A0A316AG48_9BACT|nr:dihydropteroate synthase [Dyadobacter jejuensis]PWJ56756.1 dihydropteroate synthase [Dyadobacter jejuensis]